MTILDPKVAQQIAEDALSAYPNEGCGFVYGEDRLDSRLLFDFVPVQNAKEGDQRRRFQISPIDYIKAERYADEHGIQLLGVYHSHPNHPAVPSEHDRVAAQPFFSNLIISVPESGETEIRSWRLTDESEFEEEIVFELQLSH